VKTLRWIFFSIILVFVSPAFGTEFLGLPLPEGKVLEKTDTYIKLEVPQSHEEILNFYKKLLKDEKDLKYRDWAEMTYIEDDGARPWHSINIYKKQGQNTIVQVNKDKWTWIIGTLTLRFIAVFVVLMVLQIALNISGQVFKRVFKEEEPKKA
jgi:hypothetical protein